MKITKCKYGHYYDKGYFRCCPHCNKEEKEKKSTLQDTKNENKKVKGLNRRFVRDLGREVQELMEGDHLGKQTEEQIKKQSEKKSYNIKEMHLKQQKESKVVVMAAMPAKVLKNQDFCIDVCCVNEEEWKKGADMLLFKNREGSKDLKIVSMILPDYGNIIIKYKDEVVFQSEPVLLSMKETNLYTFPVCITDNRDRRFHMINVLFVVENQEISIPLYLNPSI